MYYDKLRNYRKIILKERKINIFLLIMESLPVPFILWGTLKDIRAILILLILLVLILLSVKQISNNNRLLNQFFTIEKNNALNKLYISLLYYPKVTFLKIPEINAYQSLYSEYYGMIISDDNKNQYYYFFEEPLTYNKDSINKIIQKFNREIHIQCYENTTIIKTIENNPYFVHIRYGKFCE